MGMHGAKTPKRHIAWSNSPDVGRLDLGKLVWNFQDPQYIANRTSNTKVNKDGKKQFQGRKKELKDSQYLDMVTMVGAHVFLKTLTFRECP